MSYKVLIRSEEDFKWLTKQIQSHYESSLAQPTLYLEHVERYKRLNEDFKGFEKINDEHSVVKERVKKQDSSVKNLNYCDTHKTYKAMRAPRTDCQDCWQAYKKYAGNAKYKFARTKFDKKVAG